MVTLQDVRWLRTWFRGFVAGYMTGDADLRRNMRLKATHTARVCNEALAIARSLGLDAPALRLIETIVLLHDVGGRASLDPAGAEAAPGPGVPTFAEVRALLERSVAISHRGLVRVLARTPTPEAWSEVALLENVKLLLLRAGRCEIGGFMLVLDPDLGLTITAANTPAKGDED